MSLQPDEILRLQVAGFLGHIHAFTDDEVHHPIRKNSEAHQRSSR